ncbi:MAG: UvrD-helicase domain-containing protein [Anaerolineae bacterium]
MDTPSLLAGLKLQEDQQRAAQQRGSAVVVLAGAGCGKTTTLVARYLSLLAEGLAPQEIVAVTFTERAGQEMRVRIRQALRAHMERDRGNGTLWLERYLALDGAPIGTIHGYCARLLRAHPAEAALDPQFTVLEEAAAGALRAEAVDRALAWGCQQPLVAPCFAAFGGPERLRSLLSWLVARRPDVEEALDCSDVCGRWRSAAARWLRNLLNQGEWRACREVLMVAPQVPAGDALNSLRLEALAGLNAALAAAERGDVELALEALRVGLRRPGNVGSRKVWGDHLDHVRGALRCLCDLWQNQVGTDLDRVDPGLDRDLAGLWPGLAALSRQAWAEYAGLKASRQALDFDDLELRALELLHNAPEVAAYEQRRVGALLVDEFQDTNERQRRLLEALLGAPLGGDPRLFIVGDAKQSIYRFRGADVTVFRRVQQEVAAAGGFVCALDRTYRAHRELVSDLNALLEAVLGQGEEGRLFVVPFAPLIAARGDRTARLDAPFVELLLGLDDGAAAGRRAAAQMLAARLLDLYRAGVGWGDMACLFRATRHFPLYEDAFEQAGVPYVTVAGAGFYERPEVRDLLNALRALADLDDDLALAGLLRSPAVGLTDASLYLLRCGGPEPLRPFRQALQSDLAALEPEQRRRAQRAAEWIEDLAAIVGRLPVVTVLKQLIDVTDWCAILRRLPQTDRSYRNVEKLLADAGRSGAYGVGDLMAYIESLADVEAREGEAPAEGGEAVQLMSVHKAKGLEFDVVCIADAGHDDRPRMPDAMVHPDWGLVLRISRAEGADARVGLMHTLAGRLEQAMQDAEERRLLYVAATRAREKLLISGHVQRGKEGLLLRGWLERLRAALGEGALSPESWPEPGQQITWDCWGGRVAVALQAGQKPAEPSADVAGLSPLPSAGAFSEPVAFGYVDPLPVSSVPQATAEPQGRWRIHSARAGRAPARVVGDLVHAALRAGRRPSDEDLAQWLEAQAHAELAEAVAVQDAVRRAVVLLERWYGSAVYREASEAEQCLHEVRMIWAGGHETAGRMDLLFCRRGAWTVVEVKTDHLRGPQDLARVLPAYREQVRRYVAAAGALLGATPRGLLCFLDYERRSHSIEVAPDH